MLLPMVMVGLLCMPTAVFGILPMVGAAGVGALVGGLGVAAAANHAPVTEAPKYTNQPEANSSPQNTSSASFQPNYHNQTSPTTNITVTVPFNVPVNLGENSSTFIGTAPAGNEQNGSTLSARSDNTMTANTSPTQHHSPRWRKDKQGQHALLTQFSGRKTMVGAATVITTGVAAGYCALRSNADDLLSRPEAWHNWKRAELSTAELEHMSPEEVGELMAQDTCKTKRSFGHGQPGNGPILDIINGIDQELQELKHAQLKATWAQRLWLGGLCGVNPETVSATEKAIERNEVLRSKLCAWYAHDVSQGIKKSNLKGPGTSPFHVTQRNDIY